MRWGPIPVMGGDNEAVYRGLLGLDDEEWRALQEGGHLSRDYLAPDGTPLYPAPAPAGAAPSDAPTPPRSDAPTPRRPGEPTTGGMHRRRCKTSTVDRWKRRRHGGCRANCRRNAPPAVRNVDS